MPEDAQPVVPPPQPFTFDADKFSNLFANFRESSRDYLDLISRSFEKASDLNKQLFAFHERLLLIDLGTIGLSVTALTSVSSKAAMLGWRRYVIITLVGFAWTALLMSTFLCRAIMNDYLAANRKLYNEWMMTAFELHGTNLTSDIQRLSLAINGPIEIDGETVDSKTRFTNIADEVRTKFSEAKLTHLTKTIQTAAAGDVMSTGTASRHAIKYMQVALMLLGIAAIVLVISLSNLSPSLHSS